MNDAPTATDQSIETLEDQSTLIILSGTDIDSEIFTYDIFSDPINGNITIDGAVVTYTPALNFNGTDSFIFSIVMGSY